MLWRKVGPGLSAGRVQSVATRLVVERERERIAFVRASYWDLEGDPRPRARFDARLVAVDGARVATGRDFGIDGRLTTEGAVALDEAAAASLATGLADATFAVRSVEEKPYRRSPAAPFMTSTLQQEASRKLRMSSARSRCASPSGCTRTATSPTCAPTRRRCRRRRSRRRVQPPREIFGAENVAGRRPRQYTRKVKNAQEAHEAIRPSGDVFRTPGELAREVSPDELALYDLIWKRTVASQMSDARGQTVTVRLGATSRRRPGRRVLARPARSSRTAGFLAAYEEGRDEPRRGDDDERRLPPLAVGDALTATSLDASGHETQPPARFTEATLVKALEERGIGRPSTYASIIGRDPRPRVRLQAGHRPGPVVAGVRGHVELLEQHFGDLVDYDFTAQMEEDLDRIAVGRDRARRLADGLLLRRRCRRSPGSSGPDDLDGLRALVENLGDIDAREINTIHIGAGITLRVGRYGPYVERARRAGLRSRGPRPGRAHRRARRGAARGRRPVTARSAPTRRTARRSSPRSVASGRTSPRCLPTTPAAGRSRARPRCSRRCRSTP